MFSLEYTIYFKRMERKGWLILHSGTIRGDGTPNSIHGYQSAQIGSSGLVSTPDLKSQPNTVTNEGGLTG